MNQQQDRELAALVAAMATASASSMEAMATSAEEEEAAFFRLPPCKDSWYSTPRGTRHRRLHKPDMAYS